MRCAGLALIAALAIVGCGGKTVADGDADGGVVDAPPAHRTPRILASGAGTVKENALVQDGEMLYYQPAGAIWTVAKPGGSAPRVLVESASAAHIAVDGGELIYTTFSTGELIRRRIVDGSIISSKRGLATLSPLSFDAEFIYVVMQGRFNEEIFRINRNTGESTSFRDLADAGVPSALAGTAAGLLWSIQRGLFLRTPAGEDRLVHGNGGKRLFAFGDVVWWSHQDSEGSIWRGSLRGAPAEKIQTGAKPLGVFAVSGERLYWATPSGVSGRKLPQPEQTVWTGDNVCCVVADSARVYWIANDFKADTFRLMSLDHEPKDR